VAFRINAMAEDSESYRDYVGVERKGVNPAFAFRLGANTSAVLSLEHFQDERTADRGIPSYNGRPYQTDASTFFGNPELSYAKARANSMSLVLEHDFGNGLSLRNRTRVADYDKFYQNVFANGAANVGAGTVPLGAYNTATQRSNGFNQTDLFYSLNTGSVRHKLVAGMELGRQETDNLRQSGSSATASLAMPTSFAPVTFASTPTDANNHGVARIASFYLQDQIEFTPQWQAVVGLRYDHFKVAYLSNAPGALANLEVTDEPLSPRVGLIYKPLENVSIYGSYSVAFVPRAGEQLASLTGRIAAFDPEEFKNMELGAKWDISPDLAATAAIYQLDRSNVLITDPNNSSLSILTDGQTSKGVELSLSGKLTRSWSVMGGYAWQEAKTKFINNPALNFKSVAMVPKQTFSLWNRYDLNDHWGAGLGLVYRDSIFASGDNAVTLPSYTRVDSAVFYKVNSNYQLQMNFENLLDKEYYASAHNNNNITPGSPRAVRFTFHAKF
jgi:catecholate siderophore receptor